MEENKKSNTGLVVLVVILLLACIGMGCYIGYDKFLSKENGEIEATKVDKTDTEESNNKNDTYQVLSLSPVKGHAVVYNGEVYVNVYDSTPNIENIYGNGKYQTLIQTRNNYQEYSFGDLTMSVDSTNKWMKLDAKNVKEAHNNDYGQAISTIDPKYGILMLNSDKTVSYISIKDLIEGNNKTTKLEATDITSIVSEDNGGVTTYLVKADGTKIGANTLIK